ncbi:hypothetical protein BC830DRAFT_845049 [Chytriomyces sp. MP71]|nr:hypothetical protein BC830DRAFT_845049 [Chytriomyces sp. MP71]
MASQRHRIQRTEPVKPVPSTNTGSLHCLWHNPKGGICKHTFASPEEVHAHVEREHVGRRLYRNLVLQCRWDECKIKSQFSKRCHIIAHIRTHLPFSSVCCDSCGSAFKWPADLRKHQLRVHGGDSIRQNLTKIRHKTPNSLSDVSYFPLTPTQSCFSSNSPMQMSVEFDYLPTLQNLVFSSGNSTNEGLAAFQTVNATVFSSPVCKPAMWELHSPLDWCEWWPVYQAALLTARNLAC